MKHPTITKEQVARIKASGRVVHIMPRKNLVRLDGYQVFRLVETMPKSWEADYVAEGLGETQDFCPSDNS